MEIKTDILIKLTKKEGKSLETILKSFLKRPSDHLAIDVDLAKSLLSMIE